MSNKINVWVNEPIMGEMQTKYSAKIELPSGEIKDLWYIIPNKYADFVTTVEDPYLMATLFWAMGYGYDLYIHGAISPSLLVNLEDFQNTWICWFPERYKRVDIIVSREKEIFFSPGRKTVCAFSGGVDSCFTAYRHRNSIKHRKNLSAGLIIQGFEVPLEDNDMFTVSSTRAGILLNSLDMQLISMKSNCHQFTHEWMYEYMGGLASCMAFLSNGFEEGLVGGSRINTTSTTIAFPWGSNAISDHLLSSNSFKISNDGGFYTRTQKINEIAKWKEANEFLQVCWKNEKKTGNCGHCAKCIVNILNYRATLNAEPGCFPGHVTISDIMNMEVLYITQIEDFIEILEQAYKNNLQKEEWVKALEDIVSSKNALAIQEKWKQYLLEEFKMQFSQNFKSLRKN